MINHFVQIKKDRQFMVSLNILSIVTIKLFWFVAVLVCGRFGLWPFWFVAVMVCGRFDLHAFAGGLQVNSAFP